MNEEKDPLEGFQITGYDKETETVTIQIHKSILANADQEEPLVRKMIEIIKYKTGVSTVDVEPRSDS